MKILWTQRSKTLLEQVFQFYVAFYGKAKAVKIRDSILNAPDILEKNPFCGKIEDHFSDEQTSKIVRSIIQKHTKILYEVLEKEQVVLILTVFDTRQDPDIISI